MEFSSVFSELKKIMQPYANDLVCQSDVHGNYSLDTNHVMKNGRPLFFGAVQIRKKYVSFHLMPVYLNPGLLERVPADLKKRMQGKSCFNFTTVDSELFGELRDLTRSGFQYYKKEGYL